MPESAYDRQLRRAWRGDYSADESWTPPSLESRPPSVEAAAADPADARRRSRREIETIVGGESEPLAQARKQGESKMKLAKFVKFREEKFGGVLFETRNEKVYTLNPTGAAVVREIVAGSPDVIAALKNRFDDKEGKMTAEAQAFLDDLKTKGLIEA
jgi:hypothetical protein